MKFKLKEIAQKINRRILRPYQEIRLYNNFYKKPTSEKNGKGNILIYAGIGYMYLTPVEILLYHLLSDNGYNVDYLIYDENVEINELITAAVVKNGKDKFWNNSVKRAKKILSAAGVNYSFITKRPEVEEILDNGDIYDLEQILSFKHEGVDFGNIVEGVMYRYYKSKKFGSDASSVARKFLTTALTNYYQIKHLSNTKQYEYVMFSHGIYCTWEPVVHYCQSYNLNYISYDRAKTKGYCNFNLNQPSPVWDFSAAWNRLKEQSLTEAELDQVNDYLEDRILQRNDVYAYNFSEKEKDVSTLKQRLGIAPNAKVITLFTNLIWDAANVSRDIAFGSVLDCITETIRFFKNRGDVHILIRTHPAEKIIGTKERYGTLIKAHFNNELTSNVTIIEPEDSINSFSVIDITTIGVTHTSTVGLELAINNKPSILISETHYRDKGFTYDVNSNSEYFEVLENLLRSPLPKNNQVELAKKYFYIMMFEYQHLMPMAFDDRGVFKGYSYSGFQQLLEDEDAPIQQIVNRIMANTPVTDFIFK